MNPLHLQQVLMNLLLNAQAAMTKCEDGPKGGRLTVAAITRADGTVGIRVSDSGPGIPKEIAGRIFEPFVTTKKPGSSGGGRGLGLAICRRLVEDAGGTITATSTQGRGTTFLVVLPSPKARHAKAV
jgi:signal transduction histidine kinase